MNLNTTSKIYSILDKNSLFATHTVDAPDYVFTGASSGSHDYVFTGVGATVSEAIEDLLDGLASILTISESDMMVIIDHLLKLDLPDMACDHSSHPGDADECSWLWYLTVRFNVAPACVAACIVYDDNVISASVGIQVDPWNDLSFRRYSTISESFWLDGNPDPDHLERLRRNAMRICQEHVDSTVADLASQICRDLAIRKAALTNG